MSIIDKGKLLIDVSIKELLSKLHVETFHLDAQQGRSEISLTGCDFQWLDDHTLEVEVLKEQGLNSIFEQLTRQGICITSMRSKANRLEELFMRLVQEGRLQ